MKRIVQRCMLLFMAWCLLASGAPLFGWSKASADSSSFKLLIKEAAWEEDGSINGIIVNRTSEPVTAQLIAAVYSEQNALIDANIQSVTVQNGESQSFSAAIESEFNPHKSTIKVFAWNNLAEKLPVSDVNTINPYGLTETTAPLIDPLSFLVGRVARSYTESEDKALTADLTEFIDHENKTVRSITGELDWDFDTGFIQMNTPHSQGVTGLLKDMGRIELENVIIEAANDFGTIMVTSLDGLPIADSKKLLIQAMTEDRGYGFKTEPVSSGPNAGFERILSLGSGPMNVKKLDAAVTLKLDGIESIYAVNENGYVREEMQGQRVDGGVKLTLLEDVIYTVVEREGLVDKYVPSGEDTSPDPVYVWFEGEDFTETNFPYEESAHSADTFEPQETRQLLSGGDWLTASGVDIDEENPPFAKYAVNVPEDGTYNFFVRKFWYHGPYYWRFDDGEWQHLDRNITLLDETSFRLHLGANWVNKGTVDLTEGQHTFEIKLAKEIENGSPLAAHAGFDAFILIKDAFQPKGTLRPGEKLGLAEDGYWAFEPDMDPFSENAILDLQDLNEDAAGQDGFIRKERDKLVLGNGEEARFWAVNSGTDILNMQKSELTYFAKMLAKRGVNMVRLHGMLFDENGEISERDLDRFHYMVHAFKEEGIYINLSYYFVLWWDMQKSDVHNGKGEGYPYFDWNKNPFGLILFDEDQQEIYKKGVRRILLSDNPYTHLTAAEDPGIGLIEIQNEDSYLFWTFESYRFPEKIKLELFKKFGDWVGAKYGSIDAAYDSWGTPGRVWNDKPAEGILEIVSIGDIHGATGTSSDDKRRRDTLQFLVESQRAFYEEMVHFLEDEIGTRSVISASNWITSHPQRLEALERYTYAAADIVDRHAYREPNHIPLDPSRTYAVSTGDLFKSSPVTLDPSANPVKVVHNDDQPSMISETTWSNPTYYGAEGPFMYSAYGSLQGIDLIVNFATATPAWSSTWSKWPIMAPTMLGQYPAFALMFRRGDVTEAKNVVHESISLDSLYQLQGTKIFESLDLDSYRDNL